MGRLSRSVSAVCDYGWPLLGGVACWAFAARLDRMIRWVRDEGTYEPDTLFA